MGACPTIETERLMLRPFREDDVDAYTAVLQTPEVRASLHLPDDISRYDAWLGHRAVARAVGAARHRAVGARGEGDRVRSSDAPGTHFPAHDDWPGIEIGWALHPDHWGKGYATEAGAAAVEYAFAHHDVDALYSVILPENTASQAVARALGFTLYENARALALPVDGARDLAPTRRTLSARDVERLGDARRHAVFAGVGLHRDAVGVRRR